MKKIKILVSSVGPRTPAATPYAVCCSQCKGWVHKKCSDTTDWLSLPYVSCKARLIDGRPVPQVDVDKTMLDVEAAFIYMNDTGAVTVPLPPDAVGPGECSRNTCPSSPSGASRLSCAGRYLWPVSIRLCSAVAKRWDWTPLTCTGSAKMTTAWSTGSVVAKAYTKHREWYFRGLFFFKILIYVVIQLIQWKGPVVSAVMSIMEWATVMHHQR